MESTGIASFTQANSRYCVFCGNPLIDGSCPSDTCDSKTPIEVDGARPRTSLSIRRVALPATLVVLVAATVALAWVAVGLDGSLDRLQKAQARSERDLKPQLRAAVEQGNSLERTLSDQSVRLGSLEARLASQRDPAEVAAAVRPSVFTVRSGDGLGSGFVIKSEGGTSSIVTNFHVIADLWLDDRRDVVLQREDVTYHGTVQKVSEAEDLALISVSGTLPALTASADEATVGETVLVVGSPLGLGGSVASGIVSATRTTEGIDYVQFSAPISPGNSGGPVVDRDGRVIGVAVGKFVGRGAEGISLAVPIGKVCHQFGVC